MAETSGTHEQLQILLARNAILSPPRCHHHSPPPAPLTTSRTQTPMQIHAMRLSHRSQCRPNTSLASSPDVWRALPRSLPPVLSAIGTRSSSSASPKTLAAALSPLKEPSSLARSSLSPPNSHQPPRSQPHSQSHPQSLPNNPSLEHDPAAPLRRQAVVDYLASMGVEPDFLEDVAVPESIEVAKERLLFLANLGIDPAAAVNRFPPLISCSIARNFVPVLAFLETLPVDKGDLPALLSMYPQVLYSSIAIDLVPQLDFLEGLGIAKEDLAKVIVRFPKVLGLKLEGTMSTSVAYLVGLGVRPRAIGPMLTQQPEILAMRVATMIKPRVDWLMGLGLSQARVAAMLEGHPYVLCFDLQEQMMRTAHALREDGGVLESEVGELVARYPPVLGADVSAMLAPRRDWLVNWLGLPASDVTRILTSMPQVLVMDTVKAEEKVAWLLGWGFSRGDVAYMLAECPHVIGLRVEASLRPRLDFLLQQCSRPLSDVVDYPQSLLWEVAALQERQQRADVAGVGECSLRWMLACDDAAFAQRLQAGYGGVRR